jgi:hypothetical protein
MLEDNHEKNKRVKYIIVKQFKTQIMQTNHNIKK